MGLSIFELDYAGSYNAGHLTRDESQARKQSNIQ